MPEPSKKFISYIKKMVFEKSGKILPEEEAWNAANNPIGFFEVLHKIAKVLGFGGFEAGHVEAGTGRKVIIDPLSLEYDEEELKVR